MLFHAKLNQCWEGAQKEMMGVEMPTIALGELLNNLENFYVNEVQALWDAAVQQQAEWRGRG